jgi:hypothetical protein
MRIFSPMAQQPLVGQGLLIVEVVTQLGATSRGVAGSINDGV